MTTITDVAARIKTENNYTDPADATVEYLIDNAVDFINMEAGTTIAHVSSNDLTASDSELVVVKSLSVLMLRAYKDRGPDTAVAGLSVSTVLADPQYDLFTKLVFRGINRLRGRSFERT